MGKIKDITGNKYGKLTVISSVGSRHKKIYWLCQCECGNKTEVSGVSLRNNNTKSCGCLKHTRRDMGAHNLSKTRINNIYHNMKQRCDNPNCNVYSNYGGRGITVCEEWKRDFMSFYNWAMEHGYKDTLSIDRIDVNGNYEPNNCRWVTQKKQMSNTRRNLIYSIDNEQLCLSEWCEKYKMPYWTVLRRIQRGYDIKTALTKPLDITRRNKLYKERK